MINEYTKSGFLWGLAGTLCMTIFMVMGMASDVAPMPEPIPIAIVKVFLGEASKPVLMISGMVSHFLYGGVAGAVLLFFLEEKVSLYWGFGFGVLLWLIMQVAVLPMIGWGLFGTAETPKIAVGTLVLHLIYGGVYGWGTSTGE